MEQAKDKEIKTKLSQLKATGKIDMPIDFNKALASHARAKATWNDITPLAQRDWIVWIITAKQTATRERRIIKGIDMLSKGKRRPCCFGGTNWVIREFEKNKNTRD